MNLQKLIFTENACYKAGKKITPKGIIVHSTGANNPNLKRYVGPDDGKLGVNQYDNHWNHFHPGGKDVGDHAYVNKNNDGKCDICGGREVCVHAFIGKLADGSVATYQTLSWDHRGWHCGGAGNNTHIGFEICEDGLSDPVYFGKVYREAVELCAYLCKQYKLTEADVICHSEGYKKGIASNHNDVMHWLPKHGKNMDTFRADVKALLNKPEAKTLYCVQVGAYENKANAEATLAKLKAAGFEGYITTKGEAVKQPVAATPAPAPAPAPKKTNEQIAKEVINGDWGNGAERKKRLTEAGYDYAAVQKIVNKMLS